MGWRGDGIVMYLGITFSCVPSRISHVQRIDNSLCTRACGVSVTGIGSKACGIADGTEVRRLDALVQVWCTLITLTIGNL